MVLNDYGKLIILCIGLLGGFALFFVPDIDPVIPMAIIGPILGYVTGNGRLAIRGNPQSPMLAPKDDAD